MSSLLQPTSLNPEPFVDKVLETKLIPNLSPPSHFSDEQKEGWEEHGREIARTMLLYCTQKVVEKLTDPETGDLVGQISRRQAARCVDHPHQPIALIGTSFLAAYTGGDCEIVRKKQRGRPAMVFSFLSPAPPTYEELAYILGPRGGKWEEWRRQVDEYREATARWERKKAQKIQTEPPALAYAV